MRAIKVSTLLIFGVSAFSGDANSLEINTMAKLASDYVYRGISQSNGNPVVQVMPKVSTQDGFHVLGFVSPVDFGSGNPAKVEYDVAAGVERATSAIYWSARIWRFNYSGQSGLNSTEFRSFVKYGRLDCTYGYTFDMAHTAASANHLEVGVSEPWNAYIARAHIGHSFFSDNKFYEDHYHAKLSISRVVYEAVVEANYSKTINGNYENSGGERFFISITKEF